MTSSDFVSASVTYNNPLAPNLNNTNGANPLTDVPASWSFSAGSTTYTPSNSHLYVAQVTTDSFGDIVGWDFDVYAGLSGLTGPHIYSDSIGGDAQAQTGGIVIEPYTQQDYALAVGGIHDWTTAPEPSTLSAMAGGSLLLFGLLRRRTRRG